MAEQDIRVFFSDLPDPRIDRTKRHLLQDIIVIAVLALKGNQPTLAQQVEAAFVTAELADEPLRQLQLDSPPSQPSIHLATHRWSSLKYFNIPSSLRLAWRAPRRLCWTDNPIGTA